MNDILLLALLCCCNSGRDNACPANCCDPLSLIVCCLAFSKCLGTGVSSLSTMNCSC